MITQQVIHGLAGETKAMNGVYLTAEIFGTDKVNEVSMFLCLHGACERHRVFLI